MKTDLYTKIVLTVIAIALSVIALRDISFVSTAQATSVAATPAPAAVNREVVDVNIVKVGGYSVYSKSLPVDVK